MPMLRRVADPELVRWVAERTQGDGACGYDAAGWEASTWILHAMYENPGLPADVTYDDVEKALRGARGRRRRRPVVERLIESGQATEILRGASRRPGPGWRRLSWRELGARLGRDPLGCAHPPSLGSFPYRSWPVNIDGPEEGSLDRDELERLVDHLARGTEGGLEAECVAFYGQIPAAEFDEATLFQGRLGHISRLHAVVDLSGSPSNFWPVDRSWFVYTDYDLCGTKVSGDRGLIRRLEGDPELESASLPF
jgi:hypothetical protein